MESYEYNTVPGKQPAFIEPAPSRTKQKIMTVTLVLVVFLAVGAGATITANILNSRVNHVEAIGVTAVSITRKGVSLATITIGRGTRVTWTNDSMLPYRLKAWQPSDVFNADVSLEQGASYSATFIKPGTYKYFNANNPSAPTAEVIVK
ncbi:MAG TPA: hypothetical protein VMR45_05025 [Patescibacteria group bacterium]|nr:hypothetical protein [Patescibacteria group bacterium]